MLWNEPRPASAVRADLPAGLNAVIARCLEKDPARRFQSAAALAAALLPFGSEAVQRAAPVLRVPVTLGGTPRPPAVAPALGKTSGTYPSPGPPQPPPAPAPADPTRLSLSAAAATGAPWTDATADPRRSTWSAGRIGRVGGAVGLLLIGGAAAGALFVARLSSVPPSPSSRAPAASIAATPSIAVSASATTTAPSAQPEPAPEPAASHPANPVAAVAPADAGAVRPGSLKPAPRAPAKPAGDPLWSTRR